MPTYPGTISLAVQPPTVEQTLRLENAIYRGLSFAELADAKRIIALEGDVATAKKRIADLEYTLERADKEVLTLTAERTTLTERIKYYEDELERVDSDNDAKDVEIKSLKSKAAMGALIIGTEMVNKALAARQ
jgi:predicted  nucleic acid-binding Zn-ribbon protein